MDFYILIALLIIGAAVGAAIAYTRLPTAPLPRFSSRRRLLNEAELEFVRVLEFALSGQFRVLLKVGLADIVEPHSALDQADRTRLQQRISKIGLDCILCDVHTFEVVAAIQWNDEPEDRFLEEALRSANMHLIRIPLKSSYTAAHLATRIESILSRDFIETLAFASTGAGVRLVSR